MNEVELRGRIIGINKQPKHSHFTLATTTNGYRAFPRVYVFDLNQKADFDKQHNIGDMVTVKARIQTAKKRPTTIVAYEITPTKRVFEEDFGVKKGVFESDVNEVKLKGALTHVYMPPASSVKLALATVRTVDAGGRTNFPVVTLFGQDATNAAAMNADAEICFIGRVQTHRSTKDGITKEYESYVGSVAKAP